MSFTQDQRRAIEARGRHLLLSAAAGSGKTFTLVQRILQLVREGENVDEMLIITFTRAAAAEMKERLIRLLSDEAEADERLSAQLRRVEYASIQTIDAFCQDVLRSHFEAADVDPVFRVPDDAELRQLEAKALDAALQEIYEADGEPLQALHFGRGAKAVGELALQLYHFAENRPDPDGWMERALIELTAGDGELWFKELLCAARRELAGLTALLQSALLLCDLPEGPAGYRPMIERDLQQIEPMLAAGYDELVGLLLGYEPMRLGRVPKDADESLKEQAKSLRDEAKKGLEKLCKLLIPRADALFDLQLNQPALKALLALTRAFSRALTELKAEKTVLAFNDIAHAALRALSDEGVASSMRARFKRIFVDEYQDVSDLQQAIFERVAGPDNLFMVGDVKQSIYRFRQAEPSLFLEKQLRYARGDGGELITLGQNYRSRASVLSFTNAVFERVMTGGDAEILYDEDARLKPGAAFEGDDPPIELLILTDGDAGGETDDEDEDIPKAEREAALIARRILEIRQGRLFDAKAGAWRDYAWSDFAILLRAKTHMLTIERALTAAGIPCYADLSGGYLDSLEVKTVLALLQVIENRRRDAPLLGALRSPIAGLSSDELALVRLHHPEGSYRDAVLGYLDQKDGTAEKLRAFEANLDRWRTLSLVLPLSQLIDTVLRESGYYGYAGGLPLGAQRQANLDLLITYASDFDAAQEGALTGFLRYVRRIEQAESDLGAAHTLGEGDDVVRLLSVHKSKGLEFPVVFAAQLGSRIARAGVKGDLLAHRALGVGISVNDQALGSRRESLPQRAIRERSKLEDLNEEMRVLYVLLTRAVDRLVLIGTAQNAPRLLAQWRVATSAQVMPKAFLDVLAPLVLALGGDLASGETEVTAQGARVRSLLIPFASVRPVSMGDMRPPDDCRPSEADVEAARRALDWVYPFADQVDKPLKLTATGLTRELTGPNVRPEITRRPRFLTGDGLTATERGTLTHAALMHLDLPALRGLSGEALLGAVRAQLDGMLARGQLYEALDPQLVTSFLESAIGLRLLASDRVEREWAFNLRMTLKEALDMDADEFLLVQGVIDCCFVEDGQWVLLDYKTDRTGDVERLRAHYGKQLQLYALALARITGIPVKEKLLCLLRHGVAIGV